MAIKNKDEILEAIRTRIGEKTDDETISFIEDVTDTFTDLEKRANSDEDWKTKYEENDKAWRERYTERFFSKEPGTEQESELNQPEPKKTFSDLFKEG